MKGNLFFNLLATQFSLPILFGFNILTFSVSFFCDTIFFFLDGGGRNRIIFFLDGGARSISFKLWEDFFFLHEGHLFGPIFLMFNNCIILFQSQIIQNYIWSFISHTPTLVYTCVYVLWVCIYVCVYTYCVYVWMNRNVHGASVAWPQVLKSSLHLLSGLLIQNRKLANFIVIKLNQTNRTI